MTTPVFRRQPVLVMETGINQVPGGAQAGWVSGNPAGLADGASVTGGVVFDLGPDWDQYPVVGLTMLPVGATGFSGVSPTGSDSTANNAGRRLTGAFTSGATFSQVFATMNSANGSVTIALRPIGRYVIVTMTNTAAGGVMGASRVTLAAYPA